MLVDQVGNWPDLRYDQKHMSNKWIFKVKCLENGSIEKFKVRLVARAIDEEVQILRRLSLEL